MWAIMPLSASSCEHGASPSLSLLPKNCIIVYSTDDVLDSWQCDNLYTQKCEQRCLVLVDSEQFSSFLELHYWALLGDGFISLSCSVFALLKNLVCSCPTRRKFCVLYPVDVPHRVGTHPGHAYLRKVPETACFSTHNMAGPSTWQRQRLGLCHLASLGHLVGIEQCPVWCPVWVSLWLTVMVDMVVDTCERNNHWGYHHETKMQQTISRKVAVTFQRWYKSTRCGPLALVWM